MNPNEIASFQEFQRRASAVHQADVTHSEMVATQVQALFNDLFVKLQNAAKQREESHAAEVKALKEKIAAALEKNQTSAKE